jgi:putative resolvase
VGAVVTHRDRVARVNAELVRAALLAHGRRLVALDDGEMTATCRRHGAEVDRLLCAAVWASVGAQPRAEAVRCAQRDVGPAGVTAGGVAAGGD